MLDQASNPPTSEESKDDAVENDAVFFVQGSNREALSLFGLSVVVGRVRAALLRIVFSRHTHTLLRVELALLTMVETMVQWARIRDHALVGRGAGGVDDGVLPALLRVRVVVQVSMVVLVCNVQCWIVVRGSGGHVEGQANGYLDSDAAGFFPHCGIVIYITARAGLRL